MNLPTFPIKDQLFGHAQSSSGDYEVPAYFTWDRKNLNKDFVFLTDMDVFDVKNYNNIKKYAWLVESPVVTPKSYQFVYENWILFDKIFTHSKLLLTRPNALLLPIGGCHLAKDEISMKYEKTKLISMMYSFKNWAPGHTIRHTTAKEFNEVIDIMGSGVTGVHLKKIHACKDYMYSVAIENYQEDFYFTEKITDCFLTGVIPIYWGCPSIGNFFNIKGIFTFNTLEELYSILKNQEYLYEFYIQNKNTIVKENFENAIKYKIAEDRLWLDYQQYLS